MVHLRLFIRFAQLDFLETVQKHERSERLFRERRVEWVGQYPQSYVDDLFRDATKMVPVHVVTTVVLDANKEVEVEAK